MPKQGLRPLVVLFLNDSFDTKRICGQFEGGEEACILLELPFSGVPFVRFVRVTGDFEVPGSIVRVPFGGSWLYPIHLLWSWATVFLRLFLWTRRNRFRITKALVIHAIYGLPFAWARRLGAVDHLLYFAGDWLKGTLPKGGSFYGHVYRNLMFPFFDSVLAKEADGIVNITEEVGRLRGEHLGRRWPGKETVYEPLLAPMVPARVKEAGAGRLLFLGSFLRNPYWDQIFELIDQWESVGFDGVDMVGPPSEDRSEFLDRVNRRKSGFIRWHGYLERSEMAKIAQRCRGGLNLQVPPSGLHANHSKNTLPAKILDYLQLGLPPLVTRHCGPFVAVLERMKLGRILGDDPGQWREEMKEYFDSLGAYARNIEGYVNDPSRGTRFDRLMGLPR